MRSAPAASTVWAGRRRPRCSSRSRRTRRAPRPLLSAALRAAQEPICGARWQACTNGPLAAGLVLGLAGASALSRSLASVLYGVQASDPVTLVIVSLALIASGATAALFPARRAARIDPMTALRNE